MSQALIVPLVAVFAVLVWAGGFLLIFAKCFRRVKPHEAILVSGTGREPRVVRNGGVMVFPIIHTAETVDLSKKILRLTRRGRDALLTKDDRVELDVVITLRVNDTSDDILKAAQRVGAERSYRSDAIQELFGPRILSAVASVASETRVDQILSERAYLESRIFEAIGKDLDGFVIDSLSLERVERAAAEHVGPFR
jgi:uncharacterized membrane protein YqiK